MDSSVFQSCSLMFEDCWAITASQKTKRLNWLDNLKKRIVKQIYFGEKICGTRSYRLSDSSFQQDCSLTGRTSLASGLIGMRLVRGTSQDHLKLIFLLFF